MRNILTIVMGMAAMAAAAQTQTPADQQQQALIEETNIIYFGDNSEPVDSDIYRGRLAQFYEDQFRHIQDPRAPYFLLMSRKGDIAMGIGGTLKAIGMYDFDGAIDGTDFSPYNIPIPLNPAQRDAMIASPSHSALFFTVFGKHKVLGEYKVYIEGKFSGPSNAFKLGKAYGTFGDWTLGYTTSTFIDPTAQPATVETDGPNSETDAKRMLLRFMHKAGSHLRYAISVENPVMDIPQLAGSYTNIPNYAPDVAAFIQYERGSDHVRLSGIVRPLGYRQVAADNNRHILGWGLNLTTAYHPVLPLTVYAAVNTGQGIGDMVNDLKCGSNDLLPLSDKPGQMYAPWSYGWYAALQYHYNPKVFSTVIFSQERILPRSESVYGGNQYKYGLYATANVFWNITPRMQVGAEFNIGRRGNIDGEHRNAYRAGVVAEFSF